MRQTAPGTADALEAAAERRQVGDVQAAGVDAANAAHRDRDAIDRSQHDRVELLALLGAALLGVVELAERAPVAQAEALVVDQHRGGDQRAGERAAPGLVGAGDVARAQRAVEAKQPRRLAAPAAGPGARGSRSGPAASR